MAWILVPLSRGKKAAVRPRAASFPDNLNQLRSP